MRLNIIFCALAIALSGCSSAPVIQLNPGADQVTTVEYLSPAQKADLVETTMITCELGKNFVSQESNAEACKNQLRNKAYKIGGSVVLLEPEKQQLGRMDYNALTGTTHCDNCVKMRGIVFKSKK